VFFAAPGVTGGGGSWKFFLAVLALRILLGVYYTPNSVPRTRHRLSDADPFVGVTVNLVRTVQCICIPNDVKFIAVPMVWFNNTVYPSEFFRPTGPEASQSQTFTFLVRDQRLGANVASTQGPTGLGNHIKNKMVTSTSRLGSGSSVGQGGRRFYFR